MKVLFIIISSNTEPIYAEHKKVWSSYMNSNPDIDSYFIEYRNEHQALEGNTLFLTGTESFTNIVKKTIDGIQYFLELKDYDFIVRTNLSSVWNFKVLLKHIETLPTNHVYNGVIGKGMGIPFISGAGIIFSRDVANILIKNRNVAEVINVLDDVAIGFIMYTLGITCSWGTRYGEQYNEQAYHYRVKQTNGQREKEPDIMKRILSRINA